jgi:hypothetical protein
MVKNYKHRVELIFIITQHSRDEELMRNLVFYFGCGRYVLYENKNYGNFIATRLEDNLKIILFFEKYPIRGVKHLDLADFKEAAELMKNKAHLIPVCYKNIHKIKKGMNSGRK